MGNYCYNQGYYISEGIKHIIKGYSTNGCFYNRNISELVIFSSFFKHINCRYNQIKELKIPNGTRFVYCENNKKKELYLPNSLKRLYCDIGVKVYNIPKGCTIEYYRII